jgi:RNA polymerase sigma factor (sigma-70 family)
VTHVAEAELSGEAIGVLRQGVMLLALRELRDAEMANEVAQETVVRLMDAMAKRAASIANYAAFARGIARNLIADTRFRLGRTRPVEAVENSVDHSVGEDPLRSIVQGEELSRVRTALKKLSATDRALLHSLYVLDLSPGEIADRTGEPSERIRKRKSRALSHLRAAFFGHVMASGETRSTPDSGEDA